MNHKTDKPINSERELAIKILKLVKDNLNDINPKADAKIANEIKELIDEEINRDDN